MISLMYLSCEPKVTTMTTKPTLYPYVDASEPSGEELRRIREEIDEAVRGALNPELREEIEARMPGKFTYLSQRDLEPIIDRVSTQISDYERGRDPVPPVIMRFMRLLRVMVRQDPEPAASAVEAWWRRKQDEADE